MRRLLERMERAARAPSQRPTEFAGLNERILVLFDGCLISLTEVSTPKSAEDG